MLCSTNVWTVSASSSKRSGVSDTLILNVEGDREALNGERGEQIATKARLESQIGETGLQMLQIQTNCTSKVVDALRGVQARMFELKERYVNAQNHLTRLDIVAPPDGKVLGLTGHTVGGVIRPGDPILNIVPENDVLIVEARVGPNDVDRVYIGQTAQVRLSALPYRSTPILEGLLTNLSPDIINNASTGESHFDARVEIPPEQMELLGDIVLVAGMPADVLIEAGHGPATGYLLDPLIKLFEYEAFRE